MNQFRKTDKNYPNRSITMAAFPIDTQELKPPQSVTSAEVESVIPSPADTFTPTLNEQPANLDSSAVGLTDTRSPRARRWSPLENVCVRSFKATKEANIPLKDVTILVGPNGCGKSSVLQAIHWAARAASYVFPKNTKEMISFERLDYVPSSDPLTTLHNGELKSDSSSTPVEVVFTEALERAAPEFETQIVLTTHSPHIVRAASPSARLVWMRNGVVETDDDEAIRRLLGWGGLDKAALFFIEDEDDKPLRAILRQWPDLSRQISVCRCFGIDNLPRDRFLQGLLVDGELKTNAMLHRDRDFMTESEVTKWCQSYKTNGVFPWVTRGSDVEAYFCEPQYLAALFSVTVEEANEWRNSAAQSVTKARETFLEKRRNVVRALWPHGGSPDAEVMWEDAGGKTPETVKGKKLLGALKAEVKRQKKDSKLLDNFTIPSGFELANDLKIVITSMLGTAVKGS